MSGAPRKQNVQLNRQFNTINGILSGSTRPRKQAPTAAKSSDLSCEDKVPKKTQQKSDRQPTQSKGVKRPAAPSDYEAYTKKPRLSAELPSKKHDPKLRPVATPSKSVGLSKPTGSSDYEIFKSKLRARQESAARASKASGPTPKEAIPTPKDVDKTILKPLEPTREHILAPEATPPPSSKPTTKPLPPSFPISIKSLLILQCPNSTSKGDIASVSKAKIGLRARAFATCNRRMSPHFLGRDIDSKLLVGPAVVINNVDVFYYQEHAYVAMEHGLVLAAHYLDYLNIPFNQKVRFEGRKPQWVRKLEANALNRRTCSLPGLKQPDCLMPRVGDVITIYYVDKVTEWTIARWVDGNEIGVFPWRRTYSMTWKEAEDKERFLGKTDEYALGGAAEEHLDLYTSANGFIYEEEEDEYVGVKGFPDVEDWAEELHDIDTDKACHFIEFRTSGGIKKDFELIEALHNHREKPVSLLLWAKIAGIRQKKASKSVRRLAQGSRSGSVGSS